MEIIVEAANKVLNNVLEQGSLRSPQEISSQQLYIEIKKKLKQILFSTY